MTTNVLSLPGSATQTSLIFPANLSFDEWLEVGQQLCNAKESVKWWIGDWINFGENRYGEKYSQALDTTGLDYQTLQNIAWTARKVPADKRRSGLSFSHHVEVARLEPADQATALSFAEQEGLTTKELRTYLRENGPSANTPKPVWKIEASILKSFDMEIEAETEEEALKKALSRIRRELDDSHITWKVTER